MLRYVATSKTLLLLIECVFVLYQPLAKPFVVIIASCTSYNIAIAHPIPYNFCGLAKSFKCPQDCGNTYMNI